MSYPEINAPTTRALCMHAWRKGWKVGTDLANRGRSAVDTVYHQHWRAGFEAGRAAARAAEDAYAKHLKEVLP